MRKAGRANIIGQNILDVIRKWTEVKIKKLGKFVYWNKLSN